MSHKDKNTSIFPPPSSKGGTSSFTVTVLLAALIPTPCCFSKATRMKKGQTQRAGADDADGQESNLALKEFVSFGKFAIYRIDLTISNAETEEEGISTLCDHVKSL
nr:hypothetical protein Iba_chr14dCG10540 [Ipomoea batatas]